jgi:hypothetical protein
MITRHKLLPAEIEKIRRQILKQVEAYRRELERKIMEIEDGTDES